MVKRSFYIFWIYLFVLGTISCRSHRENIMFTTGGYPTVSQFSTSSDSLYLIVPFDILEIQIFTKSGERLIDPEGKLEDSAPSISENNNLYYVDKDGTVNLPMVGRTSLAGLSSKEAEVVLQKSYSRYYDGLFIRVAFQNKRITVLGAGGGKVISLENQNTTLTEAIALAGGIDNFGNASNIRLIRGQEVIVANLSTMEGLTIAQQIVMPGDIIYIEPVRRPFSEGLREIAPGIGILSGIISFTALLLNFTR